MSCSLYRWTEDCEGQPCPGDCDFCDKGYSEDDDGEEEPADNRPLAERVKAYMERGMKNG